MKTAYRYIKFVHHAFSALSWDCLNKKHGDILGRVDWEHHWRQYVFIPTSQNIIFSADCLDDISHFLKQLNTEAR